MLASIPSPSSGLETLSALPQRAVEVRVAERSIEGRHSYIGRVLKRAPAAQLAYQSLELRFASLQRLASTKPLAAAPKFGDWRRGQGQRFFFGGTGTPTQVLRALQQQLQLHGFESSAGFREVVLNCPQALLCCAVNACATETLKHCTFWR